MRFLFKLVANTLAISVFPTLPPLPKKVGGLEQELGEELLSKLYLQYKNHSKVFVRFLGWSYWTLFANLI